MKSNAKKSTTTSRTAAQAANQPFFAKAGGGNFFAPVNRAAAPSVQMKMAVNKPGDKFEQEADKMAGKVMRMPTPAASAPEEKVQRQEEEKLQKQENEEIQKGELSEEQVQESKEEETEKQDRKQNDLLEQGETVQPKSHEQKKVDEEVTAEDNSVAGTSKTPVPRAKNSAINRTSNETTPNIIETENAIAESAMSLEGQSTETQSADIALSDIMAVPPTDPMPSLINWLGPIEAAPFEQKSENSFTLSPDADGGNYSPSPAPSQPFSERNQIVAGEHSIDRTVIRPEAEFPEAAEADTASGEEFVAGTNHAEIQELPGMIFVSSAESQQQLEVQAEELRTNLNSNAEALRQSVRTQVEISTAFLHTSYADEHAALERSLEAAYAQVDSTLEARQAEVATNGEAAKARVTELFVQHRTEVETTIHDNIAAAEAMRTHYAAEVRERTAGQAAEAQQRGQAKGASYPNDERGRIQANAARGVAQQTSLEIEQRGPEAVSAIEEVVSEIPNQFQEKGQEALNGFDEGLPDLLTQIDEQMQAANDALTAQAAQSSEQLNILGVQMHAQIDALETAAITRAEAIEPQIEAQIESGLQNALTQIDSAVPQAIEQVRQVEDEAVQILLDLDSPDPEAAKGFSGQLIEVIFDIAGTAGDGLQQAATEMNNVFQESDIAASDSLQEIEQQSIEGLQSLQETNDSTLSDFVVSVDEAFGNIPLALEEGFSEIETQVDDSLRQVAQDLSDDFGQALQDAEGEIVNAVDEGLGKNDEALNQLDSSMQEAASDAAWDYDHPVLSTLRDIGLIVAGVLVGIVAAIALIVVVIVAFKLLVAGLIALGVSAAVAEAIVLVAGLALLAYGVYEAYQARVAAGESGGWGTFGLALLDMTGLTDMYRAFTAEGLTPFERGFLFGEGLVKLAATILLVRGAWRFVRSGGLRAAWQGLWRGAGRVVRGIGRGIQRAGRWIRRQVSRKGRITKPNQRAPRPDDLVGCFIAGTFIHTTEGKKTIEQIQVGNKVLSASPISDHLKNCRVTNTFVHIVSEILEIKVGGVKIVCSPHHPFWVSDQGWYEAIFLQIGTRLVTSDGQTVSIESIRKRTGLFQVFNIEVEEFHTYFVSSIGILVHNKGAETFKTRLARDVIKEMQDRPGGETAEAWELRTLSKGKKMANLDPNLGPNQVRYQARFFDTFNEEYVDISVNYDVDTGLFGIIKFASGK